MAFREINFDEDEVKLRYQNALKAEVHGFSESVKSKNSHNNGLEIF